MTTTSHQPSKKGEELWEASISDLELKIKGKTSLITMGNPLLRKELIREMLG